MHVYGKLPYKELENLLHKLISKDPQVIVGPRVGEDAAIIRVGDKVIAIHCDPITGAEKRIGWLAVNVASNDIATTGFRPKWILVVMLLPRKELLDEISEQLRSAAAELGVKIIGGHTEITPGLSRPIVMVTAIGEGDPGSYVTSSGVREGDRLILTKGAGIEGTAILAEEFYEKLASKLSKDLLDRARDFIKMISVVKDAMIAMEVGGVHAMHDPTEGGLLGGIQELAIASNLGVIVRERDVLVRRETRAICRVLGIDPYRLISSGSLLIAADPERAKDIVGRLKEEGIEAKIIGKFVKGRKRVFKTLRGEEIDLNEPVKEELWTALSIL